MSKICIFGGAGFIGTALVRKLITKNDITIYDNFSPQVHKNISIPKYLKNFPNKKPKIVKADVLDKNSLYPFLKNNKFDIFCYFISETGTSQSMDEISRYSLTNIHGCSVFFEGLIKSRQVPKKIYLTSSRAVYGEGGGFSSKKIKPLSFYGLNKYVQEEIFRYFCNLLGIELIIFRLQNIYGPGQAINNPYTGVLNYFIKQALNNQDIEIYDNGEITRDFVYIDDLVNILLTNSAQIGIMDVGSGLRVKLLDIAKIIKKQTKSKNKILITNKHRKGDVISACSNTTHKTKVALKTGVKNLIKYIKENEKSTN